MRKTIFLHSWGGARQSEKEERASKALTRENLSAVMRELKRMQDEPGYVSVWEPKTTLDAVKQAAPSMRGDCAKCYPK